jgi:hypothetical protein
MTSRPFGRCARSAAAGWARTSPRVFEFSVQLQTPQRIVPHPLELAGQRAQAFAPGAVQPPLAVAPADDEAGVGERTQVKRDGAKGDVGHRRVDVAGRDFAVPDQPEDFLPPGAGNGREDRGLESHGHKFRLN